MTSKRDRDNLDKAVLDALTNVILTDDKLVYDGRIQKWYAEGDELPHTKITIEWNETPEVR
jgi:Holliday junction resolvase RusA-like endonuclease